MVALAAVEFNIFFIFLLSYTPLWYTKGKGESTIFAPLA